VIALLGGYGAVGLAAARCLERAGLGPLRLGGRRPETARARGGVPGGATTLERVDLEDDASLAAFLRGCALVVNCAGPSHRAAARVARAAAAAGLPHVDAGGAGLERRDDLGGGTSIFAAGALPGLSGMLPRWLAARFDRVEALTVQTGVLDRFTAAGAEDFLAGLFDAPSASMAPPLARPAVGLSGGRARRWQTLPFFPGEVMVTPYCDSESRAVARALGVSDSHWAQVSHGEHLPAALDAAPGLDRAEAVRLLCRAAELDLAGRAPAMRMVVRIDGVVGGVPAGRTAVMHADGVAPLAGAVVAAVAALVRRGRLPSGRYAAGSIADPAPVIAALSAMPEIEGPIVLNRPGHAAEDFIEGAL